MNLHRPVTSAFPAALAAASITLSLLLIPGGGSSLHSSGVAPALRLVAGDVATVVQAPVQAVTRTHHHQKSVASSPPTAAPTQQQRTPVTHRASSPSRTHSVPTHRSVRHRNVSSSTTAPAKRQTV